MLNLLAPYKKVILTVLGTAILSGLVYGGISLYKYHVKAIDTAVTAAVSQVLLEQQAFINEREEILLEEANKSKKELEQKIAVERLRVRDLERMLLIDHDLDKLLQQKPGLVIKSMNEGTAQFFKELEEATQ